MNRRQALATGLCAVANSALPRVAAAQQSTCPAVAHPAEALLESGDLLFTKIPGLQLLPFSTSPDGTQETPEAAWQRGRMAVIAELEALPARTPDDKKLLAYLRDPARSFAEFRAAYELGLEEGGLVPLSDNLRGLSNRVGHVAIVEIVDGYRNIIEAVLNGVQRRPYTAWSAQRSAQQVWHHRYFGDGSTAAAADVRHRIALAAAENVTRPYSLGKSAASFRLDDKSDFYCSKLVWLAVREVTGNALDGKGHTFRLRPVSPLTFSGSALLKEIGARGDYKTC